MGVLHTFVRGGWNFFGAGGCCVLHAAEVLPPWNSSREKTLVFKTRKAPLRVASNQAQTSLIRFSDGEFGCSEARAGEGAGGAGKGHSLISCGRSPPTYLRSILAFFLYPGFPRNEAVCLADGACSWSILQLRLAIRIRKVEGSWVVRENCIYLGRVSIKWYGCFFLDFFPQTFKP